MSDSTLLQQLDEGILTITLNRPDKLNAYTAQMGRELADAFRRADVDDAVRVVIVTGAGKAFCAGADISGGAASFGDTARLFGEGRSEAAPRPAGGFIEAIFDCRKPSIAAINGAAVGVGLTMTLPMDIRLAANGARFGCVFTRRGLVPEAASAWFLPRIVGLPRALRWSYSGRVFDAAEAERGGLIEPALASDDLLPRAREIAREIADNTAPVAIALTRQLLWRFSAEPQPWGLLQVDTALNIHLGAGPDVREGVAAFLEKRAPAFPGKVSTDMPPQYPWWTAA
ncbi:MAG: enoyl-CoA hydratase [Burkholderiales bacterium RIFCSPHIGHO2_12_FULL_69_20]|nr:MAG: enoyl-CoA hydratase [Burkholderiales bacterium RIFCSPHIGHO2_12_FULL_69_20]